MRLMQVTGYQSSPHLVLEAHPVRIFGEDLQIRPSLSRRLHGLVREMDGPVDVGERASLFGPLCRWQDDVGECGGLGREDVLCNYEEVLAREILSYARKLWHRYCRATDRGERQ